MNKKTDQILTPSILAPAGNKASFLAAVAAGADAVYCGLKRFSARMEAKNFALEELASLTRLAHGRGIKVYVAINSILKPDELEAAAGILEQLQHQVKPDALIIQDLSLIRLAKQTGFSGELHLSTLANVSFSAALKLVREELGIDRVILPRELSIDEIKALASACPEGLDLEVFVHGALCYGVSGRCYWSSFLGGKSGLRGRCVQPCRRLYTQKHHAARFFSCMDLSLDVLVKTLLDVPKVRAWKIEGRKKGPHYVFYTVKAYQSLRDLGHDPQAKGDRKKAALELLYHALGRPGTHYHFLPQRMQNPIKPDGQTASGLLMGKIKGTEKKPYFSPRYDILPGDVLRLGSEDEPWHQIYRVRKFVPSKGRMYIKLFSVTRPRNGTSIFLIDRREKDLEELLTAMEKELEPISQSQVARSALRVKLPARSRKRTLGMTLHVFRKPDRQNMRGPQGIWLSPESQKGLSRTWISGIWWWLSPVLWPVEEKKWEALIDRVLKDGARNFVLNAPWQIGLFPVRKGLSFWAGPFCNISNALAIDTLISLGFSGAIVSPELAREDYLRLVRESPLPLGIVVSGNWPLCISRMVSENLKTEQAFTSPKGEQGWVRQYGSDYWVYPNWKLDITSEKAQLQLAGYGLFVHLIEPLPPGLELKRRPGMWNWNLGLA
jgi:putative protease